MQFVTCCMVSSLIFMPLPALMLSSKIRRFQRNNCMKRQRIIVIVHLHIPMIFRYRFLDALNAEAMPALIRFVGGEASVRA